MFILYGWEDTWCLQLSDASALCTLSCIWSIIIVFMITIITKISGKTHTSHIYQIILQFLKFISRTSSWVSVEFWKTWESKRETTCLIQAFRLELKIQSMYLQHITDPCWWAPSILAFTLVNVEPMITLTRWPIISNWVFCSFAAPLGNLCTPPVHRLPPMEKGATADSVWLSTLCKTSPLPRFKVF